MKNVKTRLGKLQYSSTKRSVGKRGKWGFKFTSPDGAIHMESRKTFDSLAKAEKSFFEAVKSIATNQYTIGYPESPSVSKN